MDTTIDGRRVHFRVDGPQDAPWVTLAHALTQHAGLLDEVAAGLAGRFRVLRYDMRGHGASEATPPPYTLATLADDALALWDHLEIERSHWVGLALGGMVGLHLAARDPLRLRSLVACSCRADADAAYASVFEDRIRITREGGMMAIVDRTLARSFRTAFIAQRPDIVARYRSAILATSTDGHIGCCEAVRGLSEGHALPQLRVPTLFVTGEHDVAAPPRVVRALHLAAPGSTFAEIPNAGHALAGEQPHAFVAAVESFIAAH